MSYTNHNVEMILPILPILPIQLGLCCLNTQLREQKPPIFASRSIILKTFHEKGFEHLEKKIIENLKDVLKMMEWNENNGIKVFRLSSEMFPHKSNPLAPDYSLDFARDLLQEIGEKSKQLNQRLTFHPGQYNVIGTPTKESFEKTILDLKYHADVLDLMNLDNDSVIVIHGGGVYGDKTATIERWCKQFYDLPENVQKRIVIENCEKNFSVIDCLKVSDTINIPVVFDTHHFECYKKLHPDEHFEDPEVYMHAVLETWWRRDIKPKFHISEQGSGRIGHHSDFIETIPEYLLEIPEKYLCNIDIMIEAKMKEQAIFRLYEKYPEIFTQKQPNNTKQPKQCKKKPASLAMQWASKKYNECDCC